MSTPGPDRRGRRQRQQVRVVVQQRRQDRHHPSRSGMPDVDVHAPDQHLPAPPLGAVDQLLVAVALGELLRGPGANGCVPAPNRSTPSSSAGGHDHGEGLAQVGDRLARRCRRCRSRPRRCCASSSLCSRSGRAAGPSARANRSAAVLRGRGSSGRRARAPTPRRASAPARRGSRCAPVSVAHPAASAPLLRPCHGVTSRTRRAPDEHQADWRSETPRAQPDDGLLPAHRGDAAVLGRRRRRRDRDDARRWPDPGRSARPRST